MEHFTILDHIHRETCVWSSSISQCQHAARLQLLDLHLRLRAQTPHLRVGDAEVDVDAWRKGLVA